jgi:hypothetical protein
VYKTILQDCFKECSASTAAVSSIRLLVEAALKPERSVTEPSAWMITAPQPPGPGLGLQAPSVYIFSSANDKSVYLAVGWPPGLCQSRIEFNYCSTAAGHSALMRHFRISIIPVSPAYFTRS